jgi:hypothetical protein
MSQTIYIIRHAEKPDGVSAGVDENGSPSNKSLTPRGWQRAGAWVELFAPSFGQATLARPTALFASTPEGHHESTAGNGSKSQRPLETITPLAGKLGIQIDLNFTKGNEAALSQAISAAGGVVLVCWQHEAILDIVNALSPPPRGLPGSWPGDRFNVIFELVRSANGSDWSFRQIVPQVFGDDNADPI